MYVCKFIIVVQVFRTTSISPGKLQISSKLSMTCLRSRYPPEDVVVLRLPGGGAACFPNVMFSNRSAPSCQKRCIGEWNLIISFVPFENISGTDGINDISDMA